MSPAFPPLIPLEIWRTQLGHEFLRGILIAIPPGILFRTFSGDFIPDIFSRNSLEGFFFRVSNQRFPPGIPLEICTINYSGDPFDFFTSSSRISFAVSPGIPLEFPYEFLRTSLRNSFRILAGNSFRSPSGISQKFVGEFYSSYYENFFGAPPGTPTVFFMDSQGILLVFLQKFLGFPP